MTTSLTRGLPRRLTWPSPWSSETRCPRSDALEAAALATGLWRVTCNTGRYVEAHTPTTALERLGVGGRLVVARDVALGDLQGDRVDVVAGEVVLAAALVARADAHAARHVDVDGVEGRAEVDEERVVDLAGEDLAAARQALDGLVGDRVVVRERLGPDVVRRRGRPLASSLLLTWWPWS